MPRQSSTLDEAVMLIQILTRIPKGRLITAQQLKQELDAAGISELTRTPVTGSGIAPQDY